MSRACLTDFGLAALALDLVVGHESDSTPLLQEAGSLRWMAPELFGDKSDKTSMSDVYALGMVTLEVR